MVLKEPTRKRGYKKERIIRVLLCHHGKDITKYRVANEADVSEPWCRSYTETLEEKQLLNGTQIPNSKHLYKEWLETRIQPTQTKLSNQHINEHLQQTNLKYALTTYTAENHLQGTLFPTTTDFYIHPTETNEWLEVIEEKALIGGGNTRILITDKHVNQNHGATWR